MNKEQGSFTHLDYRNAKVIHLVEKDQTERFIYKKAEISKEEADEITKSFYEEKKRGSCEKGSGYGK